MSAGPVKLTEVATEMEASTIVGFLRANGIEAGFDTFSVPEPLGYAIPSTGRQEIFVRSEDLDRARELLADANEGQASA